MTAPAPSSDLQQLQQDASEASAALPPLLLQAEKLVATVTAGIHGRRRAGSGETFWQYRPYIQGDAASLIDWRQSARASDRLYVRQREWEIAATAWLWCDRNQSLDFAHDDTLPTKRARAQVLATALTSLLTRAGERAGLMGISSRPLMGRRAPELFARQLLTAQRAHDANPLASDTLPPLLDGPGGKQAVLISDFFYPLDRLEEHFAVMAAARVKAHLIQIIDPSEEDFPFQGRTEFLPLRSGETPMTFGNASALSKDYRRLFRAHHEALGDICRHLGWTLTLHRTDHQPHSCLILLYQMLEHDLATGGGNAA